MNNSCQTIIISKVFVDIDSFYLSMKYQNISNCISIFWLIRKEPGTSQALYLIKIYKLLLAKYQMFFFRN